MALVSEDYSSNILNCLLCLSANDDMIEIYGIKGHTLNISAIISQHFWFQNDAYPYKSVCQLCWLKIIEFHDFYCKVEILHKKENGKEQQELQDSKLDNLDLKLEEQLFEVQVLGPIEEIITADVDIKSECSESSDDEDQPDNFSSDSESLKLSDLKKSIAKPKTRPKRETSVQSNSKRQAKLCPEQLQKIEREDKHIRDYCKMKCDVCLLEMETFHEIRTHHRKEHKQKGYIECCGKKYYERTRIMEHILVHLNPDSFQCELCNKNYANQRSLDNHKILVHAPDEARPYKCEKCPKSYAKSYQLSQHQVHHLSKEEKKFMCHQCDKAFASNCILQHHIRQIHEGAYSMMCDICSKVLKSKATFLIHRKEHTEVKQEVKKIQCTICSSWLKNMKSIKIHMKSHEDESKLFICDICGKQSPNRTALHKHKRYLHMMERKHKCTLCEKAFKRALNLREHMTTHTGEVLYSCPYCTKTFNSSANMHAHKKKIHKKEWEENQRLKALNLTESDLYQMSELTA